MPIRCAGFDHTIDYTANTVQLSVPRSCVGNPRWVEVNYVGLGNVDARLRNAYGDDYGLVVETAPGAGTKVIVRVPKFAPGVHAQ